ncbi:MAG: hypothetical protein BAA04_06970 [Firmicutes bacterium ZCTH02-B6]|nr:MAG: hypothetical protein BAA04_06970 [Firmicutes bacterium ZCTH02-B6]
MRWMASALVFALVAMVATPGLAQGIQADRIENILTRMEELEMFGGSLSRIADEVVPMYAPEVGVFFYVGTNWMTSAQDVDRAIRRALRLFLPSLESFRDDERVTVIAQPSFGGGWQLVYILQKNHYDQPEQWITYYNEWGPAW